MALCRDKKHCRASRDSAAFDFTAKKFSEQVAHIQMGGLFLLKALTHTDVTHLRSMANAPSEYEALAPILSSRALWPTAQTNVCHQL